MNNIFYINVNINDDTVSISEYTDNIDYEKLNKVTRISDYNYESYFYNKDISNIKDKYERYIQTLSYAQHYIFNQYNYNNSHIREKIHLILEQKKENYKDTYFLKIDDKYHIDYGYEVDKDGIKIGYDDTKNYINQFLDRKVIYLSDKSFEDVVKKLYKELKITRSHCDYAIKVLEYNMDDMLNEKDMIVKGV